MAATANPTLNSIPRTVRPIKSPARWTDKKESSSKFPISARPRHGYARSPDDLIAAVVSHAEHKRDDDTDVISTYGDAYSDAIEYIKKDVHAADVLTSMIDVADWIKSYSGHGALQGHGALVRLLIEYDFLVEDSEDE